MILFILSVYLFVGVMLLSLMFVNSFIRGKSSYAKALGALCLTLQIYLLGYLMEINVDTLARMKFWNQIQYLGIPFFPTLWLVVSMLYTGRKNNLKGYKGILLFVIPMMTFIMRLTNNLHHLYYRKIELQYVDNMSVMYLTKGPWYFVQMAYVLFTLILCTWFYFKRYKKSTGDERMQFRILLIASILPYLALVLVSTNLGGIGIDYTAVILPPCILMINLALTKYNFLEIKLLARERVFEDSASGLILLNRFYRIVDFNNASLGYFKWLNSSLEEAYLDQILKNNQELLDSIKNLEVRVFMLFADGEERYLETSVRKIANRGDLVGFLVTFDDVTERERLKKKLLEMASVDELSGLSNRRKFRESATEIFDRAIRYGESISVLMMDIDYFKKVNDTYGHQTGDEVIKEFARIMLDLFRGTDIAGRMGGEEFAVVMLNTDAKSAFNKAENFRKMIEGNVMYCGSVPFQITVSIGVATFDQTTQNLDMLVSQADHALYEAKRTGRNKTVISQS
ncbi:MAG: diguanylate cyclase [Lachnospiraceae bacterium]|nr:diguanylate cyclase [Lachnospiraceae bacterium]